MNDPYQPVSCGRHERIEYAVLRRSLIDLVYFDDSGRRTEVRALPMDVYTRDSAEWLSFRVGGEERVVRLDRIENFEEIPQ